MKSFKELGVKSLSENLEGDKIKIDRILNKVITVFKYRVEDSKYAEKNYSKCLHLEIGVGDMKHVIFTGSKVLIDAIEQVPKSDFPFTTTIVRENQRFEFT